MPYQQAPSRKPVFDALRRLLGRKFRQSEVDQIDQALDDALANKTSETLSGLEKSPDTGLETRSETSDNILVWDRVTCGPSVPVIKRKTRAKPRKIGKAGTALIKRFEGCAQLRRDGLIAAYPDPGTGGDPWTIGWGATGLDDQTAADHGTRIGPMTVWNQAQCDARLANDLKHYAKDVARAIGDAPTTQQQFDALVSFHYNTGAIHRATLTKKHIAGDHKSAAAEFARWKHGGGRVLKGLVRRRAEEAKLYASG